MQALSIDRHGPPAELAIREVPDPPLPDGHVRVEIHAAGVNPSDVVSAAGRFPNAPLPRILGRDFAGRVTEGPSDWLGVDVWGTGGDLGITRDGTHAEQIVLPVAGVARRPPNLSAEEGAAAGVPFSTAWSALIGSERSAAGEWVIVSGAAGAVGSAAIALADARGAQVIALVRDDGERRRLDPEGVAGIAVSERGDLMDVVGEVTDGRGADRALNGVGAVLMRPLIDALRDGGEIVIYSAVGGREMTLDLFELYRRRLTLTGVNTAIVDVEAGARILGSLAPMFESGELRIRQRIETHPLSAAAYAYERVAAGTDAKIVLIPDSRL